jgi:cation diffusion facilitator family transporter
VTETSTGYLRGERLAYTSSWTLVLLGLVEITSGVFAGSIGLTADGIDSMSDALVSTLVWLGLKISRRSADERFHFGYYKIESFVSFVGGIALVVIAAGVFYRSYQVFLDPRPLSLPYVALVVLLAAGTVSLYRAFQMRSVAKGYNIASLKLNANNAIKDGLSSFLVFFAVLASSLGYHQMDAVGGMAVAVFIVIIAFVAIKESSLVLVDAYHNPELVEEIRGLVESEAGVRVEDVLLRSAGPYVQSEIHIKVDGSMTVKQLDQVKIGIVNRVREKCEGVRKVLVTARAT